MFSPATSVVSNFDLETKVLFVMLTFALLMALQLALNLHDRQRPDDRKTPPKDEMSLEKLFKNFLKLFL